MQQRGCISTIHCTHSTAEIAVFSLSGLGCNMPLHAAASSCDIHNTCPATCDVLYIIL